MLHVLIVEDDVGIIDFLKLELEHEGFSVSLAKKGREALSIFDRCKKEKNPIDLILLDIMLPELNGIEVLRRIRKISDVPVILLTARGETYDKVNGLDAGADDYVTKPFEIEELLARMRTIMRRMSPSLCVRDLSLDVSSMEAIVKGVTVSLSKTEFLILKFFLEHKNKVLNRDEIISEVWGRDHFIEENSVDVYVRYLRSKIDERVGEEYISTVRGVGYVIRDTL